MAREIAGKSVRFNQIVGAGFVALALAFAVACEAEGGPTGSPIVVQRQVPASVGMADVIDVSRELGDRYYDGASATFIGKDIPDPMRELGRSEADVTTPYFLMKDIPDLMRELGRSDADVTTPYFLMKDIPDPLREIGRDDQSVLVSK